MKHREEKIDWNAIINSLPEKNEAFVEDKFVIPWLRTFFGYHEDAITRQDSPKGTRRRTDILALGDNDRVSLIVEVKQHGTKDFPEFNTETGIVSEFEQLTEYLRSFYDNVNKKHIPFGIFTDGERVLVVRNYFGMVHPISYIHSLKSGKGVVYWSNEIVKAINKKEKEPIILTTYNNKGGVGKTTVSYILANYLSKIKDKSVLALDFDPLQSDFSRLFNVDSDNFYDVIDWLEGTVDKNDKKKALQLRNKNLVLALAKANESSNEAMKKGNLNKYSSLSGSITKINSSAKTISKLMKRGLLLPESASKKPEYRKFDIVIIDSPPGWWYYSMLAISLSDVIIPPINFNNGSSVINLVRFSNQYFPELFKHLNPSTNKEKENFINLRSPVFSHMVINFFDKNDKEVKEKDLDQVVARYLGKEIKDSFIRKSLFRNERADGISGRTFDAIRLPLSRSINQLSSLAIEDKDRKRVENEVHKLGEMIVSDIFPFM
ncbi:hypothetical protein EHQ46_03465 [Leptospira yanagawae]|uniref:AAA domain-containing protein n=1 Tax=Leptospira yanagawae TaxID=293069 RepID=A0ABY2M4R2_9LEPT|nr:ParA family protein [Leptospira yanagawae]TGL24192.1 hypothetical protein EHQ46_03465 [Leptospira yanagawae]